MTHEPSFAGYRLSDDGNFLLDEHGNKHFLRPKCLVAFRYLAYNHDRLICRQELIDAVWPDVIVTDDSLTKVISELRHDLGYTGLSVLQTHPKLGYMLVADVTHADTGGAVIDNPPPHAQRERERVSELN